MAASVDPGDDNGGVQSELEMQRMRVLASSRQPPVSNHEDNGVEEGNMANVATIEPTPPNGGYGWVCTFSVFLINAHTWGVNASWAVIMAHYLNTSKIEGTHLQFALVGGLSISQALIVSPLATAVRKRIGMLLTLVLGAILIFVALLTSSFATEIWQLFLSQSLCFGWGMGFSYGIASTALPPWFTSRRSLAVGISTSGAGIGGLVYSIVTNQIIEKLGVGWAYRILAFCALGSNLLAAFLLKEWGGRTQTQVVREELSFNPHDLGRIEVLLVVLWAVCTELGYIILLYSLPTYASSIGLTPAQGSVSSALLNLGLAVGRPPIGYFSDSFGRINMAGLLTFLCMVFCFTLWIPSHSYAPLLAFSLVGGMLCGIFWCTVTPVLAEVVGIPKLASTFGVICLVTALPTTFAEPVAMQLVNRDGSKVFTDAQLFVGFMFLAGSLSLWFLRCWKIFKVEAERRSANSSPMMSTPPSQRNKYWVSWLTPRMLFSAERV